MIQGSFPSVKGRTNNYYWNAYKEVNPVLHIFAYRDDKPQLYFQISFAYFHSRDSSSCMNIRESRNRFLVKIEAKWVDNLPLSTKWL